MQGEAETPEVVTPLYPALATGYSDYEGWNMTDLSAYDQYEYYGFNARDWLFSYYVGTIQLGAKVVYGGFVWLGQLDSCNFISESGENRGGVLSTAEMEEDATEGVATYNLRYIVNGADAGDFVVFWNTSLYASADNAFAADDVYFLHGVGILSTAGADIGALLVGLLFLQLPECPPLINVILATPLYACVVFLIWFIIKETLPFV
jgi:hypothetical protein